MSEVPFCPQVWARENSRVGLYQEGLCDTDFVAGEGCITPCPFACVQSPTIRPTTFLNSHIIH